MEIVIRAETVADYSKIREINNRAFNQDTEEKLIQNLRKKKEYIAELSLVAEYKNQLVGHILFFPISIIGKNNRFPTLALAPMSVLPEFQKKGIGSELIKEGLKIAKKLGFTSVIVVGHPQYYSKFGFKKASTWNIRPPFDAPDDAFMAIELVKNALMDVSGMVEYPQEYLDD
jgi:putative acetyltransferase